MVRALLSSGSVTGVLPMPAASIDGEDTATRILLYSVRYGFPSPTAFDES